MTRIFLDSGDPAETKEAIELLGFLDGQTTNPSLVARNPDVKKRVETGEKFSQEELLRFYKKTVQEISDLIPHGSVSIEVYADKETKTETMHEQGKEMFSWIPNAHIKYPVTKEGLKAAQMTLRDGGRVNLTLCFSQEQAAAVYAATKGAPKGSVFVSPFVGRLDDRGEDGLGLIENIMRMYKEGDGHVEVLAASVRNAGHLQAVFATGADQATVRLSALKEWKDIGMPREIGTGFSREGFKKISYREIDLSRSWEEYDISHDFTDTGLEKFAADWNSLLQ